MSPPKAAMDSKYKISTYTGEFVCPETEEEFTDLSWPVLSRRLLIALLLQSLTYFFASCIPRPEVNPDYRALMIPLTRIVAGFILVIAFAVKRNTTYSRRLRVLIVMAEICIGLLESADQYFYLKSIHKFYDIGTSFLVFYILIFYIIVPNKIKLTFFTCMGISITFIIITNYSGTTTPSDIFTTTIYFLITNCLGYGIQLNTNRSKREEYYQGIQLKEEIAHRKKAEKTAMEAKLLAEEANKAKSRFLAIINHEMRTPLNVVLGGVQILSKSSLPSEQREMLSLIGNSGEVLRGLIQNVLDFTGIENNKLQIRKTRFSLKQMLDELNEIYSHMAKEKKLEFSTNYKSTSIDYVIGDSLRLRQILTNLLNNAAKFTQKGSVSLYLDLLKRGKNTILLRFEIIDTGIGIPEKQFTEIIKPFTQVEQPATRNFDGSGLGLAICSELLTAMNSRLEITSKEGVGSTFSFDLPLAVDSAEYPDEEEPGVNSYRILLIDDIEANLKIVGGLLKTLDQDVVCAQGGRQGIEKSREDDFDAVIVDLHMPEKDGIETVREIRMRHPDIAAFLLTADAREEVFSELHYAGFNGYIPKPAGISQLKECLEKIETKITGGPAAIHNVDSHSRTAGKEAVPNDGGEASIDAEFMRELRNDLGDEVFVDVIKSCVNELEKEAVRIKDAGSIDDREDIIHRLKGVAGNYRLLQLWKVMEKYRSDMSTFDQNELTAILKESIGVLNKVLDTEIQQKQD